ncbi:uncharacterized protein QC761_0016350 [Podospora bellae-mahoneyi]|uniref:Uncharacterized protein n=1 Tax=Podospora bellae-mahoneyi TaxID=2093777 RepID=A0ABR0FZT9_9PEZI|nr:hypothetical protein QC761_0016350 [Podospora bellae-mahoneyi]
MKPNISRKQIFEKDNMDNVPSNRERIGNQRIPSLCLRNALCSEVQGGRFRECGQDMGMESYDAWSSQGHKSAVKHRRGSERNDLPLLETSCRFQTSQRRAQNLSTWKCFK